MLTLEPQVISEFATLPIKSTSCDLTETNWTAIPGQRLGGPVVVSDRKNIVCNSGNGGINILVIVG